MISESNLFVGVKGTIYKDSEIISDNYEVKMCLKIEGFVEWILIRELSVKLRELI